MSIFHRINSLTIVGALFGTSAMGSVASAGPLVDWLLNNRYGNQQVVAAGYPVAVTTVPAAVPYAAVPYSPTANATVLPTYVVPQNTTIPYVAGYPLTQTSGYVGIPQTTLGYLPTGSYQTTLNKVPTTYYRPVTTLDPNTGTTVTSLQPCTSYQQQVLRVPTLTSSSYYAAYGGYGAGLPQDRFGTITGSGIAGAPGQSTLAIPSTVNTGIPLLPVNQIPVTGIVANPTPIINSTSSYAPITVQSVPSLTTPVTSYPTVPAAAYSTTPVITSAPAYSTAPAITTAPAYSSSPVVGTSPSTNYLNPSLPTYPSTSLPQTNTTQSSQYAPYYGAPTSNNGSYVQADGTIVTPLGSTMSSTPTSNTTPLPSTSAYGNPNVLPDRSSNTYPSNAYQSNQFSPSGSNYPSSGSNYSPDNVVPQGNSTNPAVSSDPASLVPPSLGPLTQQSPVGSSSLTSSDYSKLVPIDRPATKSFTRTPVEPMPQANDKLLVNKSLMPLPSTNNSVAAPTLLQPNTSGNEELKGIRPPEGFSPKPYWKSNQQSASPTALFDESEKTARKELNVINVGQQSSTPIQFIGGQTNAASQTSYLTQAVATEPSSQSNTITQPKINPYVGRRLLNQQPPANDGFKSGRN